MAKVENNVKDMKGLPKCTSGIRGLDEIQAEARREMGRRRKADVPGAKHQP